MANYLEIVTVRSAMPWPRAELAALLEDLRQSRPPGHQPRITLYRNLACEGDFSFHIACQTDGDQPPQKSLLGLCLAQSLSARGLVCHGLWRQDWTSPADEKPCGRTDQNF